MWVYIHSIILYTKFSFSLSPSKWPKTSTSSLESPGNRPPMEHAGAQILNAPLFERQLTRVYLGDPDQWGNRIMHADRQGGIVLGHPRADDPGATRRNQSRRWSEHRESRQSVFNWSDIIGMENGNIGLSSLLGNSSGPSFSTSSGRAMFKRLSRRWRSSNKPPKIVKPPSSPFSADGSNLRIESKAFSCDLPTLCWF